MHEFLKWLRQPYPYDESWKAYFYNGIYASVLITLFLLIFKPFGTSFQPHHLGEYILTCIYFGLATMFATWVYGLLSMALPQFFNERDWVVWREIVSLSLLIAFIGIMNLLLAGQFYGFKLSFTAFWQFQKYTFMVATVPVLFTVYLKQRELLRRYRSQADSLNSNLHTQLASTSPEEEMLELKGESPKEHLKYEAPSLLYIEAADNYVIITCKKEGELVSNMIRSSLKNMEKQLAAHKQFFRCHRTFIVNLNLVESVSGNAQGYKLHLKNCETELPVSRSLNKQINELLT